MGELAKITQGFLMGLQSDNLRFLMNVYAHTHIQQQDEIYFMHQEKKQIALQESF